MNISKIAIVSNSEMIKNYKDCREKAESLNKLYILKNNQLDAVLFSITKYEKLSAFIEYIESLKEDDVIKFIQRLPEEGIRERETIEQLIKDVQKNEELMADKVESFIAEIHNENKDVHEKMDDIKKKVIEGHEKILNDIRKTSQNISKEINKSQDYKLE
jgi:hypothetical protein